MANDYAAMKTKIAADLNRDDLTTPIAEEILNSIKFYQNERFWFNEVTDTITTSSGTATYLLTALDDGSPVELDSVLITISGTKQPLVARPYQWINERDPGTTFTGTPTDYCVYSQYLRLYPTPNATYTITASYLKQFAALSAGADTNPWMVEAEELIRVHTLKTLYGGKLGAPDKAMGYHQYEQTILAQLQSRTQQLTASGRFTPWG